MDIGLDDRLEVKKSSSLDNASNGTLSPNSSALGKSTLSLAEGEPQLGRSRSSIFKGSMGSSCVVFSLCM